ncbi:MAG: tRNA (5-methylaminomethyl-2-thiouridine)(34)-methyltransferase MnmD [Cytophagaceae bacterium]|nr:tRNA (5-methylaminomethyl-2-thiouridine)(34)-methyltransferase MnmD [Cytophagaceae bacterium]
MNPAEIQLIISEDGSHTLFLPHLNETYHSTRGAIAESRYVFIDAGLEKLLADNNEIVVFEVGFGTGLNALLSLMYALEKNIKVYYHTLEPYPLPEEIFSQLNYLELLNRNDLKDAYMSMHKSKNGETLKMNSHFQFTRYQSRLEDFQFENLNADIVYYDAFAPSKQAEIWSVENLKKVKSLLNEKGILVTYCANGQFKRNLKEVGFVVESLAGPLGKKEMTRGILNARN